MGNNAWKKAQAEKFNQRREENENQPPVKETRRSTKASINTMAMIALASSLQRK